MNYHLVKQLINKALNPLNVDLDDLELTVGGLEIDVADLQTDLTAVESDLTTAETNIATNTAEILNNSNRFTTHVSKLWLPSSVFQVSGPSQGFQNMGPSWLFDSAVVESVATSVLLPPSWTTFDLDIYWFNLGAGAGSVVWDIDYGEQVVGGSMASAPSSVAETAQVAGAQNVIKTLTIGTGITKLNTTGIYMFKVIRRATSASDTLANDAGFIGLMARKAS